ncbi:MAG TPA: hypothetical protein VFV55_10400 [Usitatibacteraceae bacterium]|nr:hypothetical protein [Usitatibacteraceae bacterium]
MDPHAILAKTPLGVEVLSHRDHDLPRTLRHALILVDDHSTVAGLEQKCAMIPEFAAALRELVARGLVAPRGDGVTVAPAAAAPAGATELPIVQALVGMAESILGERSGKVVKKLEGAGATREELFATVDACFKLIRLTIDEAQAEEFRRAARELLSRGD